MCEKLFMCSNCDMFGSLKENLTLKQAVLLKLPACWLLQSHGAGLAKAMSEMTSNVKIYFAMDPWFGMLGMCVG
jgi:hypothetical protein